MNNDLNNKCNNIVNDISQVQKSIIDKELKQLRNLDKLEYMNEYLTEDHVMTKKSL